MGVFGALSRWSKSFPAFILPTGFGSSLYRYMSSSTEKTVEVVTTQVPEINEVAVAAADSAFPVARLQYLIDGVHSVTGFNWWAAIALTTILVRGLPLVIRLIGHRKTANEVNGPEDDSDIEIQLLVLCKGYGISYSIFISFLLALSNMAKKVPSFKTGGALWFTDLTTPDTSLIFPVLASLSFWVNIEYRLQALLKYISQQEDFKGDPAILGMKKYGTICVRIIASLIVPIVMDFPKACFCYWITANLFSLLSFVLATPARHPVVIMISSLNNPEEPKSAASRSTPQSESSSDSAFQPHNSEKEPNQSPESSDGADRRASSGAIAKHKDTGSQID